MNRRSVYDINPFIFQILWIYFVNMRSMEWMCDFPHPNVRPAQKFRCQILQNCLDSLSCIGYINYLTLIGGPETSKG
jgi:hypothetical protein